LRLCLNNIQYGLRSGESARAVAAGMSRGVRYFGATMSVKGVYPMYKALAGILIVAGAFAAKDGAVDLTYHASRPMGDPRASALAGAGLAMPGGALTVFTNPALVHSYCKAGKYKGMLSGASYGQYDPVYDGNVVTAGAGYYSGPKGTALNMYRYLQGAEDQQTDYQVIATYAGQMFEKSDKQGAVDYGINIRYEQANWNTYGLPWMRDSLWHERDSTWVLVNPLDDSSNVPNGSVLEKRLMMDIGFFQANIFENLDFGLALHNIAGYIWGTERPQPIAYRDSIDDTTARTGTRYDTESRTTDRWIDSWYRRLSVGAVFHTRVWKDKLLLQIPLDLEFVGIFERGKHTHTLFRCGIEAVLSQRFAFRFGYGRQPDVVRIGEDPENINVFTGGLGVSIVKGLTIDGFIGLDQWGVGVSYTY
jgi:hypothetical protein